MPLPTAKTQPTLDPASAKVLLAGAPKVGKTTLASQLDPEHTLILATEPGYGAIEAFVQPIGSWDAFRQAGADLAAGGHEFTTVVIDTVDELYKMCTDSVLSGLGVSHPSDLDYGKGWAAVTDEFRLRIAKLCALGVGVWFISHAEDKDIETRVGSITKSVPSLGGKAGKWLTGFVDFILFATVEQGPEGDVRLLRTAATETFEAGGRVPLPDPLPLDATALREAMAAASPKAPAPEPEPEKKAKPKAAKPGDEPPEQPELAEAA